MNENKPLLTLEEREYLKEVIKPFRTMIYCITYRYDEEFKHHMFCFEHINTSVLCCLSIHEMSSYSFMQLKSEEIYYLEELEI